METKVEIELYLTKEELDLLTAAFEVLVAGGGAYTMLEFSRDTHEEILRKLAKLQRRAELPWKVA